MKFLYIKIDTQLDYLGDSLFHGGRELFGENFIDYPRQWYMYNSTTDEEWYNRIYWNKKIFTLYRKLDDIEIDRTNILEKIQYKFFDKIIYGLGNAGAYFDVVKKIYNKNDVILLDGGDSDGGVVGGEHGNNILKFGKYYKRELIVTPVGNGVYPIQFSIPESLVVSNEYSHTKKEWSTMIPSNCQKNYIYTKEEDYFNEYKNSKFAKTWKKGGWDCLRHYEILMNGCIPNFIDLKNCPQQTMVKLPKELLLDINDRLDRKESSDTFFNDYRCKLLEHTRNYLTTKKMFMSLL